MKIKQKICERWVIKWLYWEMLWSTHCNWTINIWAIYRKPSENETWKVLSWSFIALSLLILSPDLSGELKTPYCILAPDLGNHNTKYDIIISSQEFYGALLYCWVTSKISLGCYFAGMLHISMVWALALAYVLCIQVNQLHTYSSGHLSLYNSGWRKTVIAKYAAVWSAEHPVD